MGRNIYARKSVIGQYSHNVQNLRTSELRQVSILILKYVHFVKNIQLFPAVFCVTIITFRTKIFVAECSRGTLKTFTGVHHLFDNLVSKIALLFSSVWLLLFSKRVHKTFPENWDSKAPSIGTLLAYVETTA